MSTQVEHAKQMVDGAAVALTVGVVVGWVPVVVGVATLVWTVLRIYREYLEIKKLKKEGPH
jgi:glycerol-3-phosphate acyltransferase PlsY